MKIDGRTTGRLQRRVYHLVAAGHDDASIYATLSGDATDAGIRQAIWIVRQKFEERDGAPVRRTGPWPVSYIRNDGEVVYRVGAGHDIGERSLKAFGFKMPKESRS